MLSWDHNAYYHRAILRRLPAHSARVLEVGSGRGHLAVRLAERADEVDALDLDPAMVEATRAIVPANVRCRRADVTTAELPAGCYDAVVTLSVLHHLDLATALPLLARALRPGGVLVAVALPKSDLPRELPVEAAASLVHHVLGTVFTAVRHPYRVGLPHPTHPGAVPMKDPTLTTRQVRDVARTALPGADVRRLLLWRYLLTWTKPSAATATSPTSA
ncbi:class I SAM-dependent methyltransferase [Microlunatus ginsengisoli]|uniref:Class I SAM-dependent methyltransferase n=1 Tax=Microlunatus ginsengisoli TaxID=363863 RepID=A0ABP6Z9S9_9ACTN